VQPDRTPLSVLAVILNTNLESVVIYDGFPFASSHDVPLLKKAFALRANVIPSEQMPEPSTDDSFQRFMNDPQFVAAVKALPRG